MDNMNKNKRLYTCDDCGNRQFVAKVELARAAKPKCNRCGCSRLCESQQAAEELIDVNAARLEQKAYHQRHKS